MVTDENKSARDTAAFRRLSMLFDHGRFTETDRFARNGGDPAEVVTAFGLINGSPAYAFAQNPDVNRGAMSAAQAAKIRRLYDLALKTGAPVVGIYDSLGAYLTDGAAALSAFGDLIYAANRLSGVVPQIAWIAGPCGGSAAVLASLADLTVMSKEAELFLTPPSLLPETTGTAEFSAAVGNAHKICDSEEEAAECVRRLTALLPANNLSTAGNFDSAAPAGIAPGTAPAARELPALLTDPALLTELSDTFASEIRTYLGVLSGMTVGIVLTDRENGARITGPGARKAARFVRFCDAFSIPVLTFADCDGFELSAEAEKNGILRDVAALTHAYAEATCPKIAVVTGRAVGLAFAALAGRASGADLVFAWENAVIAPVLPETAVSILYGERLAAGESREALAAEYAAGEAGAHRAAEQGCLDDVILPEETADRIAASLDILLSKRVAGHPKKHSNLPL